MFYNDFQGLKLSALGMGTMRLPILDKNENIDEARTQEMIDYAMANGVNYYDTAWGYHGGNSQVITAKCLKKYPRESYYLANKFPGFDLNNMPKVKEIFEAQLEKCQVEYFDFYLFHNVIELNIDQYLDPQYGVYDYLMKQKENGRIKHLGFSAHGTVETMKRFLEAYGQSMEFCQIQLNWLDYDFQDAKGKLELLKEYDIPVWVMEPLRGGSLTKLDEAHIDALNAIKPGMSLAEWALRYIQSIPNVCVTLTGASSLEQITENIDIFDENKPLDKDAVDTLYKIANEKTTKTTVPCTGCRYCTEQCPQELDIPRLINIYNEHVYSGGGWMAPMILSGYPEDKKPSACLGCRACETACPQQIKISEIMADFVKRL